MQISALLHEFKILIYKSKLRY